MTIDHAVGRPAGNMADGPRPENPATRQEIAERLARFRGTKRPSEMWPGLSEPARLAAARELERVVRERLAGAPPSRVDPGGVHAPYALHVAAHTTGVGPLVGAWIERGDVLASDDVASWFALHVLHARRRWERMLGETLPAVDALLARGITPVMLKGFHTALAYYDEPGLRRMADVDVCVPAARVADAEAALRSAGFTPTTDALRPYRRDWRAATVDGAVHSLEVTHEDNPWVIEVHTSLDRHFHPGAVARLDGEGACLQPLSVAGRALLALAQPLLLLKLACHCSQELDGSRLLRLHELVTTIRRDRAAGVLRWDDVDAMLRRTGAACYAYPAFALVEELAPGTIDDRVLEHARRESTWAARHTVARLAPSGGLTDGRAVVRQWMWTRGPLALAQRLLRNVWPASFARPGDVIPGWRVRLRRLRDGALTMRAADERAAVSRPVADRPADAPPASGTRR